MHQRRPVCFRNLRQLTSAGKSPPTKGNCLARDIGQRGKHESPAQTSLSSSNRVPDDP